MRAAPAFQVSLQRFGVWRGAVLSLVALGVTVMAAWLVTRESPPVSLTFVLVVVVLTLLAALGAALAKTPAVDLRWDGRAWYLGAPSSDAISGELSVAIDLGPWMLLRFSPALPDARARVVWLPVQRRGLESQWHALRCAVYSPRPAPAEDAPVGF